MTKTWYWYNFADGYSTCVMGMSKLELAAVERKHGKLISKTRA